MYVRGSVLEPLNTRRQRVLGDAPSTSLALEAQRTIDAAAAAAAANPDNAFTRANADALAKQEYVNAVAQGKVPSYIAAPADQARFSELVDKLNATGDFTKLSAQEQYDFNTLRSRGSLDDDAAPVGGARSGVYGWDPATGTGDLPPGADRIAQVIQEHASPDYQPPAPAPTTGHYITLQGGRYVYADDGSPVPQDELNRLGLAITSSSSRTSTPAPSTPGPRLSSVPSDAADVVATSDDAPTSSGSGSSSRARGWLLIGGAAVGIGALAFLSSSHNRRS